MRRRSRAEGSHDRDLQHAADPPGERLGAFLRADRGRGELEDNVPGAGAGAGAGRGAEAGARNSAGPPAEARSGPGPRVLANLVGLLAGQPPRLDGLLQVPLEPLDVNGAQRLPDLIRALVQLLRDRLRERSVGVNAFRTLAGSGCGLDSLRAHGGERPLERPFGVPGGDPELLRERLRPLVLVGLVTLPMNLPQGTMHPCGLHVELLAEGLRMLGPELVPILDQPQRAVPGAAIAVVAAAAARAAPTVAATVFFGRMLLLSGRCGLAEPDVPRSSPATFGGL